MSIWSQNGTIFFQSPPRNSVDNIPVGVYSLEFNPDLIPGGYYLQLTSDFKLPPKVYGDNNKYADIILNSFLERTDTYTTACLSGLKGSGKTLTVKEIAIKAAALNIPTILISNPYSDSQFNTWINNIKQPCILLFDEFEKTYSKKEDLNSILTLFDGTVKSHKLCLLTMNKTLNEKDFDFFFNRPGRVYYNIEYNGLSPEVFKEYCEDNLQDKSRLEELELFINRFNFFTLDLLSILVTEMNNNPHISLVDLSSYLNIKPDLKINDLNFTNKIFNLQTGAPLGSGSGSYIFKHNQINTSFDFNSDILRHSWGHIYIPCWTIDDCIQAEKLQSQESTLVYLQESSIDPHIYDFECLTEDELVTIQNVLKEKPKEPLIYIEYRFTLKDSKDIPFKQYEDTKVVEVVLKDINLLIQIIPEYSDKKKAFAFKF